MEKRKARWPIEIWVLEYLLCFGSLVTVGAIGGAILSPFGEAIFHKPYSLEQGLRDGAFWASIWAFSIALVFVVMREHRRRQVAAESASGS